MQSIVITLLVDDNDTLINIHVPKRPWYKHLNKNLEEIIIGEATYQH